MNDCREGKVAFVGVDLPTLFEVRARVGPLHCDELPIRELEFDKTKLPAEL